MMVLFYTKMVVLSAYNFLFVNYPEGGEPVLIFSYDKRNSVRMPFDFTAWNTGNVRCRSVS